MNDLARLKLSLTNVKPTDDGVLRIEGLRELGRQLADEIFLACPHSRERSLACTHLEETIMWAVKSIVLEAAQ